MLIRKCAIIHVLLLLGIAAYAQEASAGMCEDFPRGRYGADSVRIDEWSRMMTIKTNLVGMGFLVANAAVEIDIIENLSFVLPIYYSGWDYGKNTVKFRTMQIQPEFRFYIPKAKGFYVGAHCGVGYWNVAWGGEWRYQDHKGETPFIGGGLGIGYAMHFKKNPHWGVEFSIGGGVYDVRYDVFYNEHNGPYHKRNERMVWFGVDNAAVSLIYEFGLGSKSKAKQKKVAADDDKKRRGR